METIRALSNWRLTVRREDGEITILRATSCDRRAVLPEELFGLPVTRLADRALAPGALPVEGEEVLLTGGAEEQDWDNRGIRELCLPRTLRHIDDYAFMNLRKMETLFLYDRLLSTGSCSFMNCRDFTRIELTRETQGQGPALASIVSLQPQELEVTIREADGALFRLVFPEYGELYTENHAAHLFNFNIVGAGYPYHNVFRSKSFSAADYDALWPQFLATEHEESTALRLAWLRLRYPEGLGETARARYLAYLAAHAPEALALALRENDADGLRLLLRTAQPDDAALAGALELSRELRRTEATAILLEAGHRRSAAARAKRYAL